MRVLPIALVIVLGVLIVHAATYGAGFLADPDTGLGEFRYEVGGAAGDVADDAARSLVRIVGVAFLGMAAFSALAAWMIIRRDRAALWVMLVLGGARLLVATAAAFDEHLWFDAVFFGITGVLVTAGALFLWTSGWGRPGAAPATESPPAAG